MLLIFETFLLFRDGSLWRYKWDQTLKNVEIGLYYWNHYVEISINTIFQLFIPFLWEVLNKWHILALNITSKFDPEVDQVFPMSMLFFH